MQQTIYDRIEALCAKNGMDVSALEYQMGLPKGTIWKWRKSLPSKWKIREVAEIFRVGPEALTDEKA